MYLLASVIVILATVLGIASQFIDKSILTLPLLLLQGYHYVRVSRYMPYFLLPFTAWRVADLAEE